MTLTSGLATQPLGLEVYSFETHGQIDDEFLYGFTLFKGRNTGKVHMVESVVSIGEWAELWYGTASDSGRNV